MATNLIKTLRLIGILTLEGQIIIDLLMDGKINNLLKYCYKIKRPYPTLLYHIRKLEKEGILSITRNVKQNARTSLQQVLPLEIKLNTRHEKIDKLIKAFGKEML